MRYEWIHHHKQLTVELESLRRQASRMGSAKLQRQQSAKELRASDARFSEIPEVAHETIISVDAARTIIAFNRGPENVFACRAEEVPGKQLQMLVPVRMAAERS